MELPNENDPEALKAYILTWQDRHVMAVDQEMTSQFRDLKSELKSDFNRNWRLCLKHRKDFSKNVVEPRIKEWLRNVVLPIAEQAEQELPGSKIGWSIPSSYTFVPSAMKTFFVPAAGMLACFGGAGLVFWLSTLMTGGLTFLGITITSPVPVIPPLVILSASILLAIVAIVCFCFLLLAKRRIISSFEKDFIPEIKESLIGSGYSSNGVRCSSVRNEVQHAIECAAAPVLELCKRNALNQSFTASRQNTNKASYAQNQSGKRSVKFFFKKILTLIPLLGVIGILYLYYTPEKGMKAIKIVDSWIETEGERLMKTAHADLRDRLGNDIDFKRIVSSGPYQEGNLWLLEAEVEYHDLSGRRKREVWKFEIERKNRKVVRRYPRK